MTEPTIHRPVDDIERRIEAWLRAGPDGAPEAGFERAMAASRTARQRPGWSMTTWWLPADAGARRAIGLAVVIGLLLIALVLTAVALIGGRRAVTPVVVAPTAVPRPTASPVALPTSPASITLTLVISNERPETVDFAMTGTDGGVGGFAGCIVGSTTHTLQVPWGVGVDHRLVLASDQGAAAYAGLDSGGDVTLRVRALPDGTLDVSDLEVGMSPNRGSLRPPSCTWYTEPAPGVEIPATFTGSWLTTVSSAAGTLAAGPYRLGVAGGWSEFQGATTEDMPVAYVQGAIQAIAEDRVTFGPSPICSGPATYRWAMSEDQRVLTMTPVDDACVERRALLGTQPLERDQTGSAASEVIAATPSAAPGSTASSGAATAPSPSVAPGDSGVDAISGLPAMVVDATGVGVAIEEGGRIVAVRHDAARLMVTRFDAAGRPDDRSGRATSTIAYPWPSTRTAFAIAKDGTAMALHDQGDAGFELIRYQDDGSVDTAFGESGHVLSSLGDQGAEPLYGTGATNMAIGSDGAAFVVGGSGHSSTGDGGTDARFAIATFTNDGSPDAGFGTGGQVFMDIRTGIDLVRAVSVADDGSVAVIGETGRRMAGLDPYAVVRLKPDGTPDRAFGTRGVVLTDWCCASHFAIEILRDGSIVIAGGAGQGATSGGVLARYLPDGSPDTSLAGRGLLEVPLHIAGLAVQPDGRIVVASAVGGLWRYLPSGELDATFDGGTGWPD